ncbi:glycoside hydrolase family 18 protein [Zopfia rhizophila CBS 207.26]|uniref:chitinase n=1 Tax=Zopfia rhizophila CBS 207.26 TaxID=1314779 RepID=A0A6A6DTI8_9PEZI|nr:glycoside hydrolase family 18 protein [Zopfia rhizophila CBS 207.26]
MKLLIRDIILFLSTVHGTYAGLNTKSSNNIAVYWGQNSYGRVSGSFAQQRLSYYCASTNIDIILIAFLTRFNGIGTQPELNFASSGDRCTVFDSTGLFHCPEINEDIEACQSEYNKTILLSIGGATYTEGGFGSSSAAIETANKLWAMFGPSQPSSTTLRPFGNSSIDGFDFDFESTVTNIVPFAQQLRSSMDSTSAITGKKYLLTACPQCPYPDLVNKDMLNGGAVFDAVFIQFYNNFCGLNRFPFGVDENHFNFLKWDEWAKSVSRNKKVKVFIGIPANTGAAGSGYVDLRSLALVLDYVSTFSSFGGITIWDASQAWANEGFVAGLADKLNCINSSAE